MAKSKRVGLSIPGEVDLALTRMSELTGQPKSAIITEIITDALPIIEQVIKAISEAKAGQAQAAIETTAKFLAESSLLLNQSHIEFGEMKGKHGK